MTFLLFGLTTVLVGYVAYAFYTSDAGEVKQKLEPEVKPDAVAAPAPKPKPAKKKATKPAAKKTKKAAEVKTEEVVAEPTQYRNPETGDTAAVPSNYRFAKRWIKEALVTEKLLDKIYKNNELDDKSSKKVKSALEKFKGIKKYHA